MTDQSLEGHWTGHHRVLIPFGVGKGPISIKVRTDGTFRGEVTWSDEKQPVSGQLGPSRWFIRIGSGEVPLYANPLMPSPNEMHLRGEAQFEANLVRVTIPGDQPADGSS